MKEKLIVEHFFTNSDRPIFALKNMHPAIQNYIYTGISRFSNVRERFIKLLREKSVFDSVYEAIRKGENVNEPMKPVIDYVSERNRVLYFRMRHASSAEGVGLFVVCEQTPIYATEDLQDFYYPMTTMEYSTRYARSFSIEKVYWDPALMQSEFAKEIRDTTEKSFELYQKGFEPLMELVKKRPFELNERVSTLDALRCCIPLAAHTTVILGGNPRAIIEHFKKLLTINDSFVKTYTKFALEELSKISPGFFEGLKAEMYLSERNERLKEYAKELFGDKFGHVQTDVQLYYNLPPEELALTQILYPFCNLPFIKIYDKISSLTIDERKEIFKLAEIGRPNRGKPIRAFETRHLVYEIESGWRLWKDFKRNRMNLRFHQEMRGKSGWETPDLIKESQIAKMYESLQKKVSDLIERVYRKFGKLSRAVATQGSKKRYLLCMGPRQLTMLGELRTCGEGDRGYRIIASKMIELAKCQNPRLFGHIKDNYRGVADD